MASRVFEDRVAAAASALNKIKNQPLNNLILLPIINSAAYVLGGGGDKPNISWEAARCSVVVYFSSLASEVREPARSGALKGPARGRAEPVVPPRRRATAAATARKHLI